MSTQQVRGRVEGEHATRKGEGGVGKRQAGATTMCANIGSLPVPFLTALCAVQWRVSLQQIRRHGHVDNGEGEVRWRLSRWAQARARVDDVVQRPQVRRRMGERIHGRGAYCMVACFMVVVKPFALLNCCVVRGHTERQVHGEGRQVLHRHVAQTAQGRPRGGAHAQWREV